MMELKSRYFDKDLEVFAQELMALSDEVGFRVSSRGWCYIMEQAGLINKDNFNKVADLINTCRRGGFLPIDFVAEESAREFKGVVKPDEDTLYEDFEWKIGHAGRTAENYGIDWWADEEYYIQMVVEKVDLVTLFEPVCRHYKIPIANSKGWSSMLQRAEYARRYQEAEQNGLKCVLLYCGDHDPDGLRIGDFIRKNLVDLAGVVWDDGEYGYNPENLIIDRFGLNYDFIQSNNFSWIDNLITGSGRNLASPKHKNFKMPYVQNYLESVGERKCEANVIVTKPAIARELCQGAIEKYLGDDSRKRFGSKRDQIIADFQKWKDENKIDKKLNKIKRLAVKKNELDLYGEDE